MRVTVAAVVALAVGLGMGAGVAARQGKAEILAAKEMERAAVVDGVSHDESAAADSIGPAQATDTLLAHESLDSLVDADPWDGLSVGEPHGMSDAAPAAHEPEVDALSTDAGQSGDDRLDEDASRKLAKIFAAMKPAEAAAVLAEMDDWEAKAILYGLSDRQAAQILGSLGPARAASLSRTVLTGRRGGGGW